MRARGHVRVGARGRADRRRLPLFGPGGFPSFPHVHVPVPPARATGRAEDLVQVQALVLPVDVGVDAADAADDVHDPNDGLRRA
jgi:hypothetical protein